MLPRIRPLKTAIVLLGVIVSFRVGAEFGRIYQFQNMVYELPKVENATASLRMLLGLQPSYSEYFQDLWIALAVGRGKKSGYYVDVGSGDGIEHSNTYLLDRIGWKGVCVEPFPRNMERRTCQVFSQPAYSESGKRVQFRAAGDLAGIESHLGGYKERVSEAPLVELVTTTLDEILEKAQAPNWIDYMNIDVEGAEYEVLRGLSLDRYRVGAFTIEHNFEAEKRELIHKLLRDKGYVRVRSWEVDDWYLYRDLAGKYHAFIAYASRRWAF